MFPGFLFCNERPWQNCYVKLFLLLGQARLSYDVYFMQGNADDHIQDKLTANLSEFTVSLWMKSINKSGKPILFWLGNNTVYVNFKLVDSGRSPRLCFKLDPDVFCE